MELTFDNYPDWFELQETEVKTRLIDEGMSPEIVESAYEQARGRKGISENALEKFKTNMVYQIFYFAQPKHQRKLLEKEGIRGGKRDKTGKAKVGECHDGDETYKIEANQGEVDVAESSIARVEAEDHKDDIVAEYAERLDVDYDTALLISDLIKEQVALQVAKELVHRLKTLIALLLSEPNLRIAGAALAFAADLAALNGLGTQRKYSISIGVTPAAISKKVVKFRDLLNLPDNAHGKSKKARQSYSDAQKRKHWRKRKYGDSDAA